MGIFLIILRIISILQNGDTRSSDLNYENMINHFIAFKQYTNGDIRGKLNYRNMINYLIGLMQFAN